jgi:hypothetical protein
MITAAQFALGWTARVSDTDLTQGTPSFAPPIQRIGVSTTVAATTASTAISA